VHRPRLVGRNPQATANSNATFYNRHRPRQTPRPVDLPGQARSAARPSPGRRPHRGGAVIVLAMVLFGSLALASAAAAADPVITLDPPSSVSYTSAHVSGTIETNDFSPYAYFEYTTDPFFGWQATPWQGAFPSHATVPVSADLTGLHPSTQYFVRMTAFEGESRWFSGEQSFTTEAVPPASVSIDPPAAITGHTATFSGEIDPEAPAGNPSAFDVNWRFECTPACPGLSGTIPADSVSHSVSAEATGLLPGTQYEVRLVAENAGGPASAGPEIFTTATAAPETGNLKVQPLRTEAKVEGAFNPGGVAATYHFEYGPTAAYGQSTADTTVPASGQPATAKGVLTGLAPASEYHVRLVVTNSLGTAEGPDKVFQTQDPPVAAGDCANEAIRLQQGSVSLPDCRAYELVSPPDKNGGNVSFGLTSTPNGSRVAAIASASFGDAQSNELNAPYVMTRAAGGWEAANLAPPLTGGFALNGFLQAGNFSSDLSVALTESRAWGEEMERRNILRTTIGGGTEWLTKPTQPSPTLADKVLVGYSADTSRVFFESAENFSSLDTFGLRQIWEWHGGQVRLVSFMPDGSVASTAPEVGNGLNAIGSDSTAVVQMLPEPTAVSSDGSRVFFTASTNAVQLFVREDGTVTKEVSLSQKPGSVGDEEPASVTFLGAARDGSKILFSSEAELTADATPGGGIYRYDLESGELEFLTPDSGGGGPQLQGAAGFSVDASRVYFVAGGELVAGKGQPGGHNLYYADGNQVRFIAVLDDADVRDWNSYLDPRASRVTPDGAHIAFQSVKPLTGYDQEGHAEVFKWDLGSEALTCVSCGPPGSNAEGDASVIPNPVNQIQTGDPRGLSADGSRVFFQTSDSLSPRDVNGTRDVYAWEAGHVHLISSGTGSRDSEIVDNSADGSDVFFSTNDSLVPRDVDRGAQDIYDARIGGGFDEVPETSDCEGGDCQGGSPAAPQFATPGSTQVRGPGNARAAERRQALKRCAHKKTKRAKKKCRRAVEKHFARTATSTRKGA
jgi:hypothetical protein